MTGLYTGFVSGYLFPFHERLKGHSTVAVRKSLEKSQWWTTDQIRAYQLRRLRSLLGYVENNVPYYKRLFKRYEFDAHVDSVADLQKLPILAKKDIRNHLDEFKADGVNKLARFNTGGSSGEPLVFFISNERISHDVAAKWRATRWWDVDIGDPEIVLWGSPIELGAQDWLRTIRDRLFRTKLLPAFEMSDDNLEKFIMDIRRFRPKMLFGYPSALTYLAKFAKSHSIVMNDLGAKVAFVTSERLYDDQRCLIEEIFDCPVANGYGGRDAGFIAHQCPHGGMHITAEDIIVEIVDREGNVLPAGEAGEILITHLATRHFPFIRYSTGDIGVLDDRVCDCGRGLPLLKEVQGRATDFIVAKDGAVMHGLALIYVIRDVDGIENFRITQESLDVTRIELVVSALFKQESITMIRDGFVKRLGEGVHVDVNIVDAISTEASGKYRYVVSHVTPS